jgi:uncharacterized membrane protein
MKSKLYSKIKNKYKTDKIDFLAFFLIGLFIIAFIFLSFGRHDSLKSYLNDIGVIDQVIWNTLHGHFFQITTSMYNESHLLAGHFSLIVLFFIPFYAIISSPKWLLLFQVLAVGLSAVPIYLFTKEKLKSTGVAFVFLISYLLNPILHNGLLYDFHEVVFATVFASFAFYFLEKGKDKWFIFFSVLLALSQEHLPLLVFMMGLYLMFFKKRYKFGLAVSLVSLAYFFLIIFIFMPHFSSNGAPAILNGNAMYPSRYAWIGKSMPEIVKNIITHPLAIIVVLLSPERLQYIFQLVLPVFSLALYSSPILIILPLIFINLLSNNSMTFDISFYHSAIFIPFVYFSAAYTFKKWFLDSKSMRKMFSVFILIVSLASAIIYGVSPLSYIFRISDFIPSKHAKKINEIGKLIPGNASLSVQHNLGPHFSEREKVYRFPIKKDESEYVLVDREDPYNNKSFQFFKFEYAVQEDPARWKEYIEEMKKSADYEIIYDDGAYLLFKRKNAG